LFRSQIFFLFLIINISLFSQDIKNITVINQDFKVFPLSDSNKLNPLKFSVQIGEFNSLIGSENPISKYPLLYFKKKNSYKYFVGNYYNYSSAKMMRELLIQDGLDEAFIICFGFMDISMSPVNTIKLEDASDMDLVQDKDTNLQEKVASVQERGTNVQRGESNVQEKVASVQERGTNVQVGESNVQEKVASVQERGTNVQVGESNVQGRVTKDLSSNSKREIKVNSQKIRVANKVGQDFQVFSLSDSNKLNSPKFSIQIGVFKDLIGLENPISKYQPLFYFQDENSYKYFVGNFENLSSAISLKKLLVLDGLIDPPIVCFDAQKGSSNKNSKKQSETLVYSLGNEQETNENIKKQGSVENDKLNGIEKSFLDTSSDIKEKIKKFRSLTNPSDPEQYTQNITYLDPALRISEVSDSSEFKEVFYTIQLGAYSKPLRPPNYIFKFDLFMSEHNSLFKYYNGNFKTLNEARKQRDIYRLSGLYDAFIVAYGKANKDSYLYDEEIKNIDKKININAPPQKSNNLTNPSDSEQFVQNITYLDPTLSPLEISDISEFKEVFYTIQLGAYSKPLRPPNYIFKFDLFMSEHNSLFKYYNGNFKTLDEARKQRDIYRLSGLYDAFIVAYGKK